jgi:hypothetical protein
MYAWQRFSPILWAASSNQNHIKILLHSYYNDNHQEHKKQMLAMMWEKKNTAGGNVS